jgi:membrane protein required for colicin V production
MNWLDIVLLVILAGGGYYGLKTGLITAGFTVVGVVVGIILAGQLSDDVGERITDSISNDTVVTIISYAIIIGAVVVIARVSGSILRKVISMLFLGWADKLGGLALGVVAGAAISGALITGMARLTYNFEVPTGGLPGQVVENFAPVADAKGWLEDALIGSSLVPSYIDLTDALPADALGFVPSDFQIALNILEKTIAEKEAESAS